jgi:predicted transcriptional regulator
VSASTAATIRQLEASQARLRATARKLRTQRHNHYASAVLRALEVGQYQTTTIDQAIADRRDRGR